MISIRYLIIIILGGLLLGGCGASKKVSTPDKKEVETKLELASYEIKELEAELNTDPRFTLIFFHTDWCKFCQNMKQTTFRDQRVIRKLNEDYFFVYFNAEQKQDINFGGVNYQYRARGKGSGTHEFAEIMASTDGELSYPTLVILNRNKEVVFKYNSFLSGRELLNILNDQPW